MGKHRLTDKCILIEGGHSHPDVDRIRIKDMTAKQLHKYVEFFNWDDSEKPMRRVIRHPNCDLGTAVMMFWLCSPHFYYEHTSKGEKIPDWSAGVFSLIKEIVSKVRRAHFKTARIAFNPCKHDGYDLVNDEGDPKAIGIPDFMCLPVIPGKRDVRLGGRSVPPSKPSGGRITKATKKTTRAPAHRKKKE